MICYNCGCNLSEHAFCTACGADVVLYKKIMAVSNRYYNEGLERASVRDLSGAIVSLRQSLKFNKNNIEARNLLGLVYFEMGEPVAALDEWVISKNLRQEKNMADDYINMIQSNASRLETLNQSIKKYNQAYTYCVQGSKDLAIIQLKKVLSMNPKLVHAHQLLALLYIDSEQWDRARVEIRRVLEIDRNNTMALRYRKEVDLMMTSDGTAKPASKRKDEDFVRYQADNEIIIQPVNMKERKRGGVATLVNIAIGIVIGAAAVFFLVMPGKLAEVNNEANLKIAEIGDKLDAKNTEIAKLEDQIKQEIAVQDDLRQEIDNIVGEKGTLSTIDTFQNYVSAYLDSGNAVQAMEDLDNFAEKVDLTKTSEALQKLYQSFYNEVGPILAKDLYSEGMKFYNTNDFAQAIPKLAQAVEYDAAHVDALYYLAQSYRRNGDNEKALESYKKVVELFPESNRVANSNTYIKRLSQ